MNNVRVLAVLNHVCFYRKVKLNHQTVDLIVHNTSIVVVDATIQIVIGIEYFYFSESKFVSSNLLISSNFLCVPLRNVSYHCLLYFITCCISILMFMYCSMS